MKTTKNYLDEIVHLDTKLGNNAELARLLKITRQAVHNYQNGQAMSVLVAVRVAYTLQIHPMETICATMHEQSKTPEQQRFWFLNWRQFVGVAPPRPPAGLDKV